MRRGFSTAQTTSTSTSASSIPSSGTNGSYPLISATMYTHKYLRNKNPPFVTKDERGKPSRGTTLLHHQTICCCTLSYNGLTRASLLWMISSCSAGQLPGDVRRLGLRAAFSRWAPFSTRPDLAYSSCSTSFLNGYILPQLVLYVKLGRHTIRSPYQATRASALSMLNRFVLATSVALPV